MLDKNEFCTPNNSIQALFKRRRTGSICVLISNTIKLIMMMLTIFITSRSSPEPIHDSLISSWKPAVLNDTLPTTGLECPVCLHATIPDSRVISIANL